MPSAARSAASFSHTLHLRPLAFALFGLSFCALPGMAGAQVVVAGGNTTVYKAPNGVEVIDIATANGAGVSHNVFSQFNVAPSGLVLNNGDSTQMARQSQLAGQVSANMNLNGGAKLILNEVRGTSRSTLAGHVEVLGSRAEVVIANPYGITCNGCGFINTPRVTLGSGVPTLDAEGRLTGLRVERGDILVTGSGLNGVGVDYLDLVARSIRLDGQVNASDLTLAAGANQWDYASRSASAGAPGPDAPALGIDSSALGGMYANRIRLMATEQGVGVRLLGDAAASAGELSINANGQISLQGRLSAQSGNVAVSAQGAASGIEVRGRGAAISAGGDVTLTSTAPGAGIVLADAALRAGRDLALRSAGGLTDSASAGNADATRYAAGSVALTAAGAAAIDGSSWGAGGALGMRAASLSVGANGASLYSGATGEGTLTLNTNDGKLDLGKAAVVAHGALALDAGQGALALGRDGRLAATGNVVLGAGALANEGSVISQGSLALKAASVDNKGLLQGDTGLVAAAAGSLANAAGAAMLSGAALELRAATLDNGGVIQAGTALTASVDSTLANSGKLLAGGDLSIGSASLNFAVDNRQLIQAGGKLLLGDAAHRARLANGAGAYLAGARGELQLDTLLNAGTLQGRDAFVIRSAGDATNLAGGLVLSQEGTLAVDTGGVLRNAGAVEATGALVLNAAGLFENSGTVLSARGGAVAVQGGAIDNSGAIGADGRLDLVSGGALHNSGTLQGVTGLGATVATGLFNEAGGKILSAGAVAIGGSAGSFALDNRYRIEAGKALDIGSAAARADLVNGKDAGLYGGSATLALTGLRNQGTLQADGALALDASRDISNSGALAAGGTLTIGAAMLGNSGSIAADGAAAITAGSVDNAGVLQSLGALDLMLATKLGNSGQLLTNSALQVNGSGARFDVANSGRIQAAGALAVGSAGHLAVLANSGDALLLGDSVVLRTQSLDNAGVVQGAATLDASMVGELANSGSMLARDGTLDLDAGGDIANTGGLQAGGEMLLSAGGLLDNGGTIQTVNGPLAARAAQIVNSDKGFMRSAWEMRLATGTRLDNAGRLYAGGDLSIDSTAAAFAVKNTNRIQAAGILRMGSPGHLAQLENGAAGVVLGYDVRLGLEALDNSGTIQGAAALGIDTRGTLLNRNGGTLASADADAALVLSAGGRIDNDGQVQASGALALTGAGEVRNGGKLLSGGQLAVDAGGSLVNTKLIQGKGGVQTLAASVQNTGEILSGAGLAMDGRRDRWSLVNDGRLQAAGTLAIGAPALLADLDNNATGFIVGGALDLQNNSFDNAGLVQGDSLRVSARNSLDNQASGRLLAIGAGGDGMTLSASNLSNLGAVQSSAALTVDGKTVTNIGKLYTVGATGALTVTSRGEFTNGGEVAAHGALRIDAAGNLTNLAGKKIESGDALGLVTGSRLSNNGRIASAGELTADGRGAGFSVDNMSGGQIESGAALRIGASDGLADLSNSGRIVGRSVALVGSQLNNKSASAAILTARDGGGTLDLDVTGAVANQGALHADGALVARSTGLANGVSGGISAGASLIIDARSGDVVNDGWLYAKDDLRLTTAGGIIKNTASGNIEAGNLYANTIAANGGAGSFSNFHSIHATGKLEIDTGAFLNQAGGTLPTIVRGDLVFTGGPSLVYDSGNFNCDGAAGSYHNCAHSRLWAFDFYADQKYSSTPENPGQLLAEGDIRITYRQSAANRFALISGKDVTITALGEASAFENQDMHLEREYLRRLVWIRADHDEARYPTTEAAYDSLGSRPDPREAPPSWAAPCDTHVADCESDDWLGPLANSSSNYLKRIDHTYLQGQTPYSAGIYATGNFNLKGSIAMTGAGHGAYVGNKRDDSGKAGGIGAITPGTAGDRTGLATSDGLASADSAAPGSVSGGMAAGVGASGAGSRPPGLIPLTGGAPGLTSVVGANGIRFTGPNLALPASPNGMFVVAAPNNTSYLVETNPLFVTGGATGSNYLAQRLGVNPDTVQKRLGDANYEARLVRDQLVAQTNNFLLAGYAREADQMRGLMDSAASQSAALGLEFGTALTAEQAGKLTQDLLWMVETSVNGQKVLAPVVYLSAATRAAVLSGSVVSARDVRIEGAAVDNKGGTIAASGTVDISTKGDITNTGGVIRANTVSLTSLEGSVVNQTTATYGGDDIYGRTSIGPTGTIEAVGTLAINANKDVRIVGAEVKAGGDATIRAGRDVVLDTIQNKRADSSAGSGGSANTNSSWTRNEIDVRQVGSTLSTGGNLTVASGRDVTIGGSQVVAGGKADIDAKGALNLVDRQDSNQVTTEQRSTKSGFTASGSSVGFAKTDTTETTRTRTGTSVASSISSGGDTSLKAGGTLTVRGSDVAAGGDLAVSGKDVKVLAGQDSYEQTIDKRTSTTGVSITADISAVTGKGSRPSAGDVARSARDLSSLGQLSVGINASTTTTHSDELNTTARVSTLGSGGKTTITATQGATFEGTQVNAGGDIAVNAASIDMVEARNTTSLTTRTETTGMNMSMGVDPNSIVRKAVADNLYSGGGSGVTLATVNKTTGEVSDTGSTAVLGSFTSGGSISRTATGKITDRGTQITAAQDFTQKAQAIDMLAATDTSTHAESSTSNSGRIGLSVDFGTADAARDLKDGKVGGAVGLMGGPTIGLDGNYTNNRASSGSASTTARVGNVVAGGKVTSDSTTGATRLQGTNVVAGGDVSIKGASVNMEAARDTSVETSSDKTVAIDARVAMDMSGGASGSVEGGYTGASSRNTSSKAVTGSISSGANILVETKGDASHEGTRIGAAGNVRVDAGGKVDMKAAVDTASDSSSERGYTAGASLGGKKDKGLSVGVDVVDASGASATATAGKVRAGGKLDIVSGKDITLQGTTIDAGGDATLDAKGKLDLLAATSTSTRDNISVATSLGVQHSNETRGIRGEAAVQKGGGNTLTETGSTISVGQNLTLKSGAATTMQGTQIESGAKTTIEAAGGVTKRDAITSSHSESLSVYAAGQLAGERTAAPAAGATGAAPAKGSAAGGKTSAAAAPASGASAVPSTAAKPAAAATPAAATPAAATPAKGTGARIDSGLQAAGKKMGAAADKAGELAATTSLPLAYGMKNNINDSHSTAVSIRENSAPKASAVQVPPELKQLPVVQTAVKVNEGLAASLAKYGSQAAIPDAEKRAILAAAGVQVGAGANVDALLTRTQEAGRNAAAAGLSSTTLDAASQKAALREMGLTN